MKKWESRKQKSEDGERKWDHKTTIVADHGNEKRAKPEIGTGAVRVVGSSPHKGNAEILKAEMLKWDRKTARPLDYGTTRLRTWGKG